MFVEETRVVAKALGCVFCLAGVACWLAWAFGVAGEHPGRVLVVAIGATLVAVACVIWEEYEF